MDMPKTLGDFSPEFLKLYQDTPEAFLDLEGIAPWHLDIPRMSELYMKQRRVTDMSVDDNANANEAKSYGNYMREIMQGWYRLLGYYELFKIIEEEKGLERACELMRSIWLGDLYFHDSTNIMIPYCWSFSTSFILFEGSRWGQLQSTAAKHRRAFVDQVKEVTIELSQQQAGAVAIGDFFINYAYFVKKENLDPKNPEHRKIIENDFQSLVHTLNKKLRPSFQSPFSNISIFDKPNLEFLFKDMRYPDGSAPDTDLIMETQKIFCDWFKKGDPISGLPYRFPVVTLNIRTNDQREIIDDESFNYFSEINLEKGCFNIYISSGNKIASCCRLTSDIDELAGIDSFGNGGVSLGSHRVVTINVARIGKQAQSRDMVFALLKQQIHEAKELLLVHRKLLSKNIAAGFLPFFNCGIYHEERLFSTIGLNGIYECILEQGYSMVEAEGQKLAQEILAFIKDEAKKISRETSFPFNIEQVPGESLAVKLAAKDRLLLNMDYSMYANQFIPLSVDCDIADRIKLDGTFSKLLTGGGISHLNIAEKLTHANQMKRLIRYAIECGCEHFAINYNFCQCENDHITVAGPVKHCPTCAGKIVNQITRIVGYFVPVSSWNKSRQKEHGERVFKTSGAVQQQTTDNLEISQNSL